MLPPSDGGLHCGPRVDLVGKGANGLLPPSPSGLHRGLSLPHNLGRLRPGAPAVRRRAPLRLRHRHRADLRGRRAPAVRQRAPLRRVCDLDVGHRAPRAPALEGGLHCDRKPCGLPTPVPVGAPAVQWRAPLRQLVRGVDDQRLAESSRRSAAGSIAARSRTSTPGTSQPVLPPAQRTAGSIAAPRLTA